MFSNLRSLIFKLDPETAHSLAIKSLKLNLIPNVLSEDKNNPLFLMSHAQFLHEQQRYDEAIPLYEQVIAIDNRMIQASYNLADIYIKKNNYDNAIQLYKVVFNENPNFAETGLILGQLLVLKDRYLEAIPYLQASYKTSPFDKKLLQLLGMSYFNSGKWDDAIFILSEYLDLNPSDFEVVKVKLLAHKYNGNLAQSKKELNAFIKKYPRNKMARKFRKELN